MHRSPLNFGKGNVIFSELAHGFRGSSLNKGKLSQKLKSSKTSSLKLDWFPIELTHNGTVCLIQGVFLVKSDDKGNWGNCFGALDVDHHFLKGRQMDRLRKAFVRKIEKSLLVLLGFPLPNLVDWLDLVLMGV